MTLLLFCHGPVRAPRPFFLSWPFFFSLFTSPSHCPFPVPFSLCSSTLLCRLVLSLFLWAAGAAAPFCRAAAAPAVAAALSQGHPRHQRSWAGTRHRLLSASRSWLCVESFVVRQRLSESLGEQVPRWAPGCGGGLWPARLAMGLALPWAGLQL